MTRFAEIRHALEGAPTETLVCVGAAIAGWLLGGAILKRLTGAHSRGIVTALRLASALSAVAVAFRSCTTHDAEWYAQLGDYYHPVLTMLSLLGVATALYYQRMELRETQRQASYSRQRVEQEVRRHRLSDASFVMVNEVRLVAGQYRVGLVCGGAAVAMNVHVALQFGGANAEGASFSRAVILPNERVERSISPTLNDRNVPADIEVAVQWMNVHGMRLSYTARMIGAGENFWRAPERLDTFTAIQEATLSPQ